MKLPRFAGNGGANSLVRLFSAPMTKKHIMYRPALSAIIALTAISTTPAFAQEVDPLAATPPAAESPAPVASDPLTPSADPVAAPTTDVAPVAETTTPEAAPVATAPKAKAATKPTARTAVKRSAAPAAAATAVAAPAAAPAIDPAIAPPPVGEIPAEALPPAAPVVAEAPVEPAQPVAALLPIAGAAGLGLLAILGIGLVLRRRRRSAAEEAAEQYDLVSTTPAVASEPEFRREQEPVAERPAFAWAQTPAAQAPAATAPAAAATSTALPSGFDISRFGRHVQAAYRGPSPDNPSLSLKKRLKRANFFDMKERQNGGAPATTSRRPAFSTGFVFSQAKPAYQY